MELRRTIASKTWRCLGAALTLLVVGTTTGGNASGASRSIAPPPTPSAPVQHSLPDPASLQAAFATSKHITIDDARAAFTDTRGILDFLAVNQNNNSFGGLWATYDGGYRVHLRLTGSESTSLASVLSKQVLGSVVTTAGGAPHNVLTAKLESLARTGIAAEINEDVGLIDVHDKKIIDSDSSPLLYIGSPVPLPAPAVARAGGDYWNWNGSSWSDLCTAGATWGGFGITGTLTAGHCVIPTASNYIYTDGEYSDYSGINSPLVSRACGASGDYMFVRYVTAVNEDETFLDKRTNPATATNYHIAGGLYNGQPTLKIGNTNNATNTGTVTNYASLPLGGTCAATRMTIHSTNPTAGGDSGGPVYLLYNNQWYFSGITTNGNFEQNYNMPVWNITLPGFSSIHYCYQDNVCG